MVAALFLSGSMQALQHRNQVFEMIKLLSDFNHFDIPQRLEIVERNIKNVLKIINYGTYLWAYFIAYLTLLDDNCATFKTTKHCLLLEYYFPFNLKPWSMTLIILFQTFIMRIVLTIIFVTVVMYCYSLELLIIRIEKLNQMMDDITLTKNKERNFRILQPIITYHQEIFRMFQFSNKVHIKLVVPQKLLGVCVSIISTTSFLLRKDITSFTVGVTTWFGLFLSHTFGQKMTTAGNNVANVVYNLNWYDADVVTRKQVLTLLCLSQQPLTIRVPLFGEMSYTASANELKKSYLFINSLVTIIKKKFF
ncbi:odorant receptor 43a-like [Onthophagus taurus]|uniref:odorant receptor 43a-like n=1 Tax=Onthophagus taurus TaxID=166361 RepID=UPI0039BE7E10